MKLKQAAAPPKWQRKLNRFYRDHITTTTERGTLAEFKRNLADQQAREVTCFECNHIARTIGLLK